MAGKDGNIASRLQLDGEKEYKKALNDAYRSLRVLRSELKAETAELGKNATQQDKDRKKVESLKKQIAEQEKVVKTLNKAFKESQEQYKDNQEVQDKWAEKLNKARESLAKMKSELDGTQDGLKGIGKEMKSVSFDTNQAVSTFVSFKDRMTAIKDVMSGIANGAIDGFGHATSAISDFIDEMISLMSKAWSAAGDWKQIQAMFGGDVSEIEAIYGGMQLQGVDTSNITSGIQKLEANTHSGNKDTLEALKKLKISEEKYTSHWDYYIAVMNELAKKDAAEQRKLSEAIFGDKAGATQNDVLSNWNDAKAAYKKDIEDTGLHLATGEIDKLDEVSHKITEIQELWDRIKLNVGAKLSEALNMDALSTDTLNLLRDVAKIWSGTGDRKELIIQFNEDLDKFVADVTKAMEDLTNFLDELADPMKDSDSPFIRFIGNMISSLSDILEWLSRHGEEIVSILEAILPTIVTNKVSEAVTGKGLGDWIETIGKGFVDFSLLNIAKGKAGKAATGATGAAGASTAGKTGFWSWLGGTGLGKLMGGFAESGLGDLLGAGVIGATFLGDKTETGRTLRDGGSIGEALKAGAEEIKKNSAAWAETASDVWENAARFWNKIWWGNEYGPRAAEPEYIEEKNGAYDVSDNVRKLLEDYWDFTREADFGGQSATYDRLLEEMTGQEDTLNGILDMIDDLWGSEDGGMEDLPDWWFEGEKKILEGLKAPEGWYTDVAAKMDSLINDKYTGDTKQEDVRPIEITITANSNLDGRTIASEVSRYIASGINYRLQRA